MVKKLLLPKLPRRRQLVSSKIHHLHMLLRTIHDEELLRPTTVQVSTQPDPKPSPGGSVQFCPHATSSFERIQRIVKLPNFIQSYECLDALTPGPDHHNPFTSGFRLCKPDSGSDLCISEFSFPSLCLLNRTAFSTARSVTRVSDYQALNRNT